jgi:hypothetical protein
VEAVKITVLAEAVEAVEPVKLGVSLRALILLRIQEEMEYHGLPPERFTAAEAAEVNLEVVFWKARLDLEEPEAEDEEEGFLILQRRAVQIREVAEAERVLPFLVRVSI